MKETEAKWSAYVQELLGSLPSQPTIHLGAHHQYAPNLDVTRTNFIAPSNVTVSQSYPAAQVFSAASLAQS